MADVLIVTNYSLENTRKNSEKWDIGLSGTGNRDKSKSFDEIDLTY